MKNAIITGSSSGFGYLSAFTLARKGFKVWATMRNPESKNLEKKKQLLAIAQNEGLKINVIELDVTNNVSVKKAIENVIREDGNIDVLVNNAGIMYVGITEAYSIDQAKDQFDANFFGTLRVTKAVAPYMRKQKDGLIINLTSLAGRVSFPYFGIYCATKHALEAYSQSLKYELAPFGVEVCVVEPGPFGTNILNNGPKEADREVFLSYGDYKDVPNAMLNNFAGFFQSDAALDPQIVADAIAGLAVSAKGKREERIVAGIDYGVIEYNNKVKPIQDALVGDILQMGHLLKTAL